jgi:uncharacterized protein YicC (UPF0701 family)
MIKSMTGYGQVIHDDGKKTISVEVKSLNSKYLDLNLRIPKSHSDKELEVRTMINEKLERGKISMTVEFQHYGQADVKQSYNENLFMAYYAGLKKLADRVLAPYDRLFELALNSPDVIQNNLGEEGNEEDWEIIKEVVLEALKKCDTFRCDEGNVLEKKLTQYCESINQSLQMVETLDAGRISRIREIIFYIEKLDIHEERVRLKAHLDYFLQALQGPQSNGKKLSFISQEIGREINTIGSKANDAGIQKHVVAMKEELEKIKEQLGNVL